MPEISFSERAERDLRDIADYTLEKWGVEQTRKYRKELIECITRLSSNPNLGHDASEYSTDLRRFVFRSHSIFYTPSDKGISIVRILGQREEYGCQF